MDSDNMQLVLGTGTVVAGKYRVERTLAEDAMGLVVVATHLHLEQPVALKILRGELSSRGDAVARFSREVKAIAQLRSEHVARVLDAGVTPAGMPYMVMEYLEGRSLARELQAHGPLDVATATEFVIQTCEGLAEAHAHGIVHRDIRPYNLFLVERSPGWNAIKIVDFGISKFALSDTSHVVTGVMVGSRCYMSPEQLRSTAPIDHRADIWSLGATLHELLAGRAAFDASPSLPDLATAILEKSAPGLRDLRADIPEELAAVVTRCLAKDREARFPNVGELALALLPFAAVRARVPAERAASRRPAFPVPAPESGATDADVPVAGQWKANGPSLAPVSRTLAGLGETPTPGPVTAVVREHGAAPAAAGRALQVPGDVEMETELPWSRAPKWLGMATLAAAVVLVFSAILVAAPDSRLKGSAAGAPTAQPVAVIAPTRPEAPLPTALLAPLDPNPAEVVQLVVRASPTSARLTIDGVPAAANPLRASYPKGEETHRIAASADGYDSKSKDVSFASDAIVDLNLDPHASGAIVRHHRGAVSTAPSPGPAPATQIQSGSTWVEVDSAGGHMPSRPIETRDPYGVR